MAEPTPIIRAMVAGLTQGGLSGIAEQVLAEISNLGPLDRLEDKETTPHRRMRENRRQIRIADEVVRPLIENEIAFRDAIQTIAPELRLKGVVVFEEPEEGRRARQIDDLLDAGRIEALRAFLTRWEQILPPYREFIRQ